MTEPRGRHTDEESVVTLLSRAVSDAQQVARAEIDLQKARLLARVREAQNGAIFLVAALLTGSLALTGLVVGLLLILTASLGPIWATVIVVGVLLVATALFGWLGVRHFKLMFGSDAALTKVAK